eukprot:1708935-Pyramimonas_sp.AAC.1
MRDERTETDDDTRRRRRRRWRRRGEQQEEQGEAGGRKRRRNRRSRGRRGGGRGGRGEGGGGGGMRLPSWCFQSGSAKPGLSTIGCFPSARALNDHLSTFHISTKLSRPPWWRSLAIMLAGQDARFIVRVFVVPTASNPVILTVTSESRARNSAPSPCTRSGSSAVPRSRIFQAGCSRRRGSFLG